MLHRFREEIPDGVLVDRSLSMTISPIWYLNWYRFGVSTNLRLPEHLASSLKALAEETGKSQQALIREAIEMYLRDYRLQAYPPEIRHAITPATTTFEAALARLRENSSFVSQIDTVSTETLLETLSDLRADRI